MQSFTYDEWLLWHFTHIFLDYVEKLRNLEYLPSTGMYICVRNTILGARNTQLLQC